MFGKKSEKKAADYLKKCGYDILEMNFSCRMGEIDIIASSGDVVVFVEVKARKTAVRGKGFEAVDERKMRKIIKTAQYYIAKLGSEPLCRFDVISIDGGEVTHIKNAFTL